MNGPRTPGLPTTFAQLRRVALVATGAQFVILVIVYVLWAYAGLADGADSSLAAGSVAVIGAAAMVASAQYERRPLDCSSARALSDAYATAFFIRLTLAATGSLAGFVGFTLTDNPFVYLLGMTLTLMGMALIAPTEGNLIRLQGQLDEQGCGRSLAEAIEAPPPSDD